MAKILLTIVSSTIIYVQNALSGMNQMMARQSCLLTNGKEILKMSNESIAPNSNRPEATLWEIKESIAQILYAPSEEPGEMSEEEFNELDAELGKLKIQFDEKVDACIKAIKNRKAESKMIAGEIKKLRQMKQASDNNTERIINYMMAMMTSLELTEAGTGLFKASIRNSPMTVEELDIHEVPENFVAVELKLKKREVIDHIKKTGEIPPGVDMVYGRHLRMI